MLGPFVFDPDSRPAVHFRQGAKLLEGVYNPTAYGEDPGPACIFLRAIIKS